MTKQEKRTESVGTAAGAIVGAAVGAAIGGKYRIITAALGAYLGTKCGSGIVSLAVRQEDRRKEAQLPPSESSLPNPDDVKCSHCGHMNGKDSFYCVYCGSMFDRK
jgi:phage tail tape-measure protein